jgi:hypothetical protein
MSGNDSDGWEREEDRMEVFVAHANAEEEVLANGTEILNVPVINQWEQEADKIVEVTADEEGDVQDPRQAVDQSQDD